MNTKYGIVITAAALLVLIGIALQVAPSRRHGYKAEAQMVAKPYTNAVFDRSFEARVVSTMPSVLRLWLTPSFSVPPSSGTPGVTNGVAIRVYAVGPTPTDAQRAAHDAAENLCAIVRTNYGLSGEVIDLGSAQEYSYFHDTFQPAVGRLFGH
jgi:hypothetical protein